MENNLEHKGYFGTVEFSKDDNTLYGKIIGISDLVTYEADNVKDLKKYFADAVEDYLQTCKEIGKNPDKYYKGSFNIRTSSEVHRTLAMIAEKNKLKLNEVVNKSLNYLIEHKENVLYQKE